MDPVVVYVSMCIQNGSESLGLEAMEDLDVRSGGCPPQLNSIGPYGLSTALYMRSLLSVDSVDLPSSQCICFAFRLSCFLFGLMCFANVRLINLKVSGTQRSWPVLR
jgi:hypothetical protein